MFELVVVFKEVSIVVFFDSELFIDGEEKKEQLLFNVRIFKVYGQVFEQYVKKDVKVLIGGRGFLSVNVFVMSKFVFLIFKKNICVLICFQENRVKGLLVKKFNVNIVGLRDVIIWGNIGINIASEGII